MSLYLKYRPSDFANLVWQSFVKETLQKAIEQDKTVWAYLFCWPRWTWKTTTARLLAKTINCINPDKWNPCLKCEICTDFALEKLIDIIEIDAASHTGVDNIREIIEKAQFSPTKTKYKIYIIDEVHMLSKWAFNALLKILEEPPKHVKFILATTETHKVPETIISRCQRYDFKRISNNDMKERLEFIAKSEDIKADSKSIEYIIKNSSGWLRNAISLFEQLITDSEINYENIVKKLEIVDENLIESFLNHLVSKDNKAIEIFEKMIDDGKNIKLFFKEVLFFTKNKSLEELRLWSDITKYINILEILDDSYSKTKNSLDENTTFLIWVLKILNWGITLEERPVSKWKNLNKEKTGLEKIEHNDIDDIFWETEKPQINPPVTSDIPLTKGEQNFNVDTFITKLKENWAKWWLTMAIRWTNLSINWNTLTIWVKTKIAKTQVENVDNISIMTKSLEDMWFNTPEIKIS